MLPGQLRNIEIWESPKTLAGPNQGLDQQKGADQKPGQSADGDGSWNLR
jgi:hypothetical protein